MDSRKTLPTDLVRHPKFGVAYSPETTIPADLTRQNFTAVPISYYADKLSRCRNCRRPFVFYAQEQKHWYEDLHINVTVSCPARCPECRRSRRRLRRRFQRYSLLTHKHEISDGELASLVSDAVFLYEAGLLENEQRLRRLKNIALTRIPEEPVTKEILTLLARIPEVGGHRLNHAENQVFKAIIRLIDQGADVVTEAQAMAAAIPPDNLDLAAVPSYAKAFTQLRQRGLLTGWVQDKRGVWGVRPTQAAGNEPS